ncbi:hypothetical protein [Specibacter cremeus]|uniref:hypothetical protein n=1 Tax=Specibacter cremeus TaxID=1629051 RepID=UPI000F79A8EC|nr:hypothetical protein [Specibacter cremeus]
MSFAAPVLTRSQWRVHTITETRSLWVFGDPRCDEELRRALDDGGITGDVLRGIPGHYAAVVHGPQELVLVADPLRSFPLFYTVGDGGVRVSDDALELAGTGADYVGDADSRLEFLHAGYVAGRNTLYAGVRQVQAGEFVTVGAGNAVAAHVYRRLEYTDSAIRDQDGVDAVFSAALETTMSRFLEYADGRQLVVPLSGGLDSRLLSVYLREVGYENVVNFTYGTGRTREVLISEAVAAALGQRWHFCEYREDSIRRAWDSPETAEFIRYAHAGASLPHVQDWYAVRWLRQEGLVDDDAIFLPGHTIVGNMHDEPVLDEDSTSRERIRDLILGYHYALQPNNREVTSIVRLRAAIDSFLDEVGYDGSVTARLAALEYWNVRERQTKYINNSMRNYEFFGYEWALPMLDREVYLAWGELHPDITRNRDWYRGYVNRRYAAVTGEELGTFAASTVSAGKRQAVKSVLRRIGLLGAAERTITARTVQNHPMGFNWFVTGKSPAELYRYVLRGGTPLGEYADEFLMDTWNSHCRLFTPVR